MSTKKDSGSVVGKALDAGARAAEVSRQLASVNLGAGQKLMHSQLELGAGLAGLAVGQLRSLGAIARPREFLRGQKAAGEALYAQCSRYAQSLRGIGGDAWQAYGAVAGEVFSRGKRTA